MRDLNIARIQHAAREIETNTTALKWLEQYGGHLDGKDAVGITIRPNYAGSCVGAKEAQSVLEAFARYEMGSIVQSAIANCRNTIEMCEQAIMEEASRHPVDEKNSGARDG